MTKKTQKDDLYKKLGSVSIAEPDTPLEQASIPPLLVHKKRLTLPLIALSLVFLVLLSLGLFYKVAHGSLVKVTVANMAVKSDISYSVLQEQIAVKAKNYKINFRYTDGKAKSYALDETGVNVDTKKSARVAISKINGSFIRRLEWWNPIEIQLVTKSDNISLDAFATKAATEVKIAPINAELSLADGVAVISPESNGSGSSFKDPSKVVETAVANFDSQPLALKPMTLYPSITAKDLDTSKTKATALLAKNVTFTIAGHNVAATPANIANWVDLSPVPSDKTVDVTINSGKVLDYINTIARRYITPPHARLVTNTSDGQVVLDPGYNGVDVVNKEQTATSVAKQLTNNQNVNTDLQVQYTVAQTVETQAYDKWLVADVTNKRMYAYENTTLVRSFLISAGAPATPTVIGNYKIYAKYTSQTMTGLNADGSRYNQPDVPYVNYFTGGYAIHGNYWRPASYFGNINSSHGCIGINVDDAAWIYDWAPIGTAVITHT